MRCEHGNPELANAIATGHWREAKNLTPRELALCTIAEKLSATPARIVKEDWRPLRDLGFDDKACLEVAHIVGLFNYFVRLADGFGLQPTEYAGR